MSLSLVLMAALVAVAGGVSVVLPVATAVLGQRDLASAAAGCGPISFSEPWSLSLDKLNLYVGDVVNARVLVFARNGPGHDGPAASGVIGKASFGDCVQPPIDGASVRYPAGVGAFAGSVFVADQANNRVLRFPPGPPGTPADLVFGQNGSFTSNGANVGGMSADSLDEPVRCALNAVDATGSFAVSDAANSRVLFFSLGGNTTAFSVLGQSSFTSKVVGPSSVLLTYPYGLAFDSSGGLYVADNQDHRVVYFQKNSPSATVVYGQTDMVSKLSGAGATGVSGPTDVALDADENLYVVDHGNNRVLFFLNGRTDATRVFGQGSLASTIANLGGVNPFSLSQPSGAVVGTDGTLIVADSENKRVLFFAAVEAVVSVASGKASVLIQNVAVAQGDLVSIGGNLTVIGNLTIAGNLTVPRGGVLNVQGALEVRGNLDVGDGGKVIVNGVLILTGASLSVAVTSTAPTVSVVVAQFDAVQGTVGTLSAVVPPGCTLASVTQSQTVGADSDRESKLWRRRRSWRPAAGSHYRNRSGRVRAGRSRGCRRTGCSCVQGQGVRACSVSAVQECGRSGDGNGVQGVLD
jgi:hypothetical protein